MSAQKCRMCDNPQDGQNGYCISCSNSIKGASYLMDIMNGRSGCPDGRKAVTDILQQASNNGTELYLIDIDD